jgi:hypothetical protein
MATIRLAQGLTPRKRRAKPGDLAALRRVLWQTIVEVEALIESPLVDDDGDEDPRARHALVLKAAHALAQLSGAYTRLIEGGDLEQRITALEAAVLQRRRNGHV